MRPFPPENSTSPDGESGEIKLHHRWFEVDFGGQNTEAAPYLSRASFSRVRPLVAPPPTGKYNPGGECWRQDAVSLFDPDEMSQVLHYLRQGARLLAFACRFGDSFAQTNLGQLFAPLGCLLNDDAIVDLERVRTTHPLQSWPSYPGPDPIAAMVRDGRKHLVLTIHKVTDVIDGGEFVAHSHRVAIPEGINAGGMHRITWPQMGPFIRREVGAMLTDAHTMPATAPPVLQEEILPYRITREPTQAECIAA